MMIKKLTALIKKNIIWFIVILILNLIFGWLLWLVNTNAFIYIFPTMLTGSLILYCLTILMLYKNDVKKQNSLKDFLDNPSVLNENQLLHLFYGEDRRIVMQIGETLRNDQDYIKSKTREIDEYQEYIEAWAHEIKTPLGLMTFVLDNRKDELSPAVYKRLEYVRTNIQENVERMLYYARIKSACNDYFFKDLSLEDVCTDVIEEYSPLLNEQNIDVLQNIDGYNVVSDKKGIEFILRQIISNAIKYKNDNSDSPKIIISASENEKDIILTIRDNGIGVKPYDLPFIFEKGFTGEIGEQRKNSTGMGLYLAKKVSENLKIQIEASEEYTKGFEISLSFPKVNN